MTRGEERGAKPVARGRQAGPSNWPMPSSRMAAPARVIRTKGWSPVHARWPVESRPGPEARGGSEPAGTVGATRGNPRRRPLVCTAPAVLELRDKLPGVTDPAVAKISAGLEVFLAERNSAGTEEAVETWIGADGNLAALGCLEKVMVSLLKRCPEAVDNFGTWEAASRRATRRTGRGETKVQSCES